MASGSNVLIQQLLKAEEEAEAIIRRARENRIKLLNDAIAAAENDLSQFKETEESKLLKEYESISSTGTGDCHSVSIRSPEVVRRVEMNISELNAEDPSLSVLEMHVKTFIDESDFRLKEVKSLLVDKLVNVTLDINTPSPI